MVVTAHRRPQHLDRLLSRHGHRVCSGVLLACWATFAAAGGDVRPAATSGVVVEEVARESSAGRAGIEPGDVILSWSRASGLPAGSRPRSGRVDSPFDLTAVEVEEAPRGAVTLVGRRGASESTWTLPPGRWGVTVRPALRGELLVLYEEGRGRIAAQEVEAGVAQWRNAAHRAEAVNGGDRRLAVWFSSRAGRALAGLQRWPEADTAYGEAVAQAEKDQAGATAAQLLREWGQVFEKRSEWARAEDCFHRALAFDQELDAASLAVALDLHRLGTVVRKRGDLAAARDDHQRALAIRQAVAPESVDAASSMNSLGNVAWVQGDLDVAAEHYRRALTLLEKVAPQSIDIAGTLTNLGALQYERGELAAADEYYRRSLALQERLAPESLDVAATLNNLGATAHARGDLAAAEDYFRRSLKIREAQQPESLDIAVSWNNLGVIARARGDLEAAEGYQRRALAIQERLSPESLEVAESLELLGNVMIFRGDPTAGEQCHRRALALRERLAPGSTQVADSLNNLGELAKRKGDLGPAEEYFRRALDIQQRLAPASLDVARSFHNLGDVAALRRAWSEAEAHYRRALEIRERRAPGSADQAESLHALGQTLRRAGKTGLARAAESLCGAIDALESQKAKLGGTQDAKSAFAAQYSGYHHDCLTALIGLGRPMDALHVFERSRARSLLAMLAERDLLFAELPAELDRERRLTDAAYDRAQAQLAELDAAVDAAERERLASGLRELRGKQEEISAKVRQASPRLASLQYPQPLDFGGVRDALDPGTVLLAYSVGEEETVLFVVQPASRGAATGLSVFRLPVGEKALRKEVETFRDLIELGKGVSRETLATQARGLYHLLLRPAERLIAASDRVLLSPDGPLHSLPFAALQRGRQYLVEWKPIHTVISATVYAELKRSRRQTPSTGVTLAAFGAPSYPPLAKERADAIPDAELRSVVGRGYALTPLPATREEVEAIASLFPQAALIYLGRDATEGRAKAVGRDARYLHFACHGLLDERFPLSSALALTIPEKLEEGQDNGLLQAWEIFERMRVDADLVVLSACETALGKEMGGEGLVGLTRAFQYAGARSIVASLWSVSDESTAELMKGFYGHLKAGKSKDEALRAAQIALLGKSAPPFAWAPFELIGDWQ